MATYLSHKSTRRPGVQPKEPSRINWHHPLAKGLVFFAFGTKNYVDNTPATLMFGETTPFDWHVDESGLNWETNESVRTGLFFLAPSVNRLTGSLTHSIAWNSGMDVGSTTGWALTMNIPTDLDAWTGNTTVLSVNRRATDDNWSSAVTAGGTQTYLNFTGITYEIPTKRSHIVTRNNGTMQWYTNGALAQTISSGVPTGGLDAGDSYVVLHTRNRSEISVANPPDGRTEYVAIWDRVLTPGECLEVSKDPYQILEPIVTGIHGSFYDFNYMRPDADSSVGSWTTHTGASTNLYQQIDETVASDADYVKSERDPQNSIYKVSLANPTGSVDTALPVRVKYRYQKPTGVSTTSLTVRLVEDTTTRATWTHSDISDTVVEASQSLTTGEKAAITNWSNLYIEFEADNA